MIIRVKNATGFTARSETGAMDYEIGRDESVSTAVVRGVSAVVGRESDSMPPLGRVLDPDALDVLFDPRRDGKPRVGGRLSFIFCHCRVTVDDGEYLTIRLLDHLERATDDGESSRRHLR